jgi:hypothetical protein
VILKPAAKLALTFLMFLLALGTVAAAAATHKAGPLFFAWFPLLAVAWVLTRPEEPGPVAKPADAPEVSATDVAAPSHDHGLDSMPDAGSDSMPDAGSSTTPASDESAGSVTNEAPLS